MNNRNILADSAVSAAANAAVAAWQRTRGEPSETLDRRLAELAALLSPDAVEAILDASPNQFEEDTGVPHDRPEAFVLRIAAEQRGGRIALGHTYRLAEDAVLDPGTLKSRDKIKKMEVDLQCSMALALHIHCIMDRLVRVEVQLLEMSDDGGEEP